MCACEGSFVCKRRAGTPFDPFYFDTLTFEPFNWVWEGWK